MNILNTLTTKHPGALAEAIFTLQTLSDELHTPILDYLRDNEEATLLDLLIATGTDAETLDMQLDLLCHTKVVVLKSNLYNSWYQLDCQMIKKVNSIARRLVDGK